VKYFVQVILFLAVICNSFHEIWKDNGENIITWMGNIGYPEYYHYWYLFNHKCQFFLYLSIPVYLLLYKLERVYKKLAIESIFLYIGMSMIETIHYLMFGQNRTDDQLNIEFSLLMGGFLIGNIFLVIYNKPWKELK